MSGNDSHAKVRGGKNHTRVSSDISGRDPFFTLTMAKILEKQGHLEDAMIIYRILLKRIPDSEEVKISLDRLEARAVELVGRGKRRSC